MDPPEALQGLASPWARRQEPGSPKDGWWSAQPRLLARTWLSPPPGAQSGVSSTLGRLRGSQTPHQEQSASGKWPMTPTPKLAARPAQASGCQLRGRAGGNRCGPPSPAVPDLLTKQERPGKPLLPCLCEFFVLGQVASLARAGRSPGTRSSLPPIPMGDGVEPCPAAVGVWGH